MSADENTAKEEVKTVDTVGVKLNALFAFKEGMTTVYDEAGKAQIVTVLKFLPWRVSQVKTLEKDGYEAVQVACSPKRASRSGKAEKGHLKKAGFENGAHFVREVRQSLPESIEAGQAVSIESFVAGDRIKLTSKSKGRGFTGVMKRHGFAGGPASHGSGFHRRPGSIGNCEFPGRVMPGRKMPGQFGNKNITVINVEIIDVMLDDSVLLVKGAVPGAKNTLVKMVKA